MNLSKTGALLIFALGGTVIGAWAGKPIAEMTAPGNRLKCASEQKRATGVAVVYLGAAAGAASGGTLAALSNRRRSPH
jgi:hypothetical protein